MRIELKGQGEPIPGLALPDPNISSDLPAQTFTFLENGTFSKTDWVALGYTHFEVWCIGGVGGDGGGYSYSGYESEHSYGGAGGGGGLHRVAGALTDIPDSCLVVVGKAGAKGRNGNTEFVKAPRIDPRTGLTYVPYIWDPNPAYISSLPGGDGGASTFGGTICQASGGKGGKPTPWKRSYSGDPTPEYAFGFQTPGGDGGQGGSGGRTVAGGGGDGAWSEWIIAPFPGNPTLVDYLGSDRHDAIDGTWDGAIGKGGGGGRGGCYYSQWYIMYSVSSTSLMHSATPQIDDPPGHGGYSSDGFILASSGAQGSFSYADTSVYGVRESRSTPPPPPGYISGPQFGIGKLIVPGSGGGARLNRLSGYGSTAPGFNPNGVVFIRLTKIV